MNPIRRSTLAHGLRVVTEQVPGARAFNLGVFVGVGSRDESPDEHGCSHFLEHVLFKGTPSRDAEQISAEIERFGGDLNAYTTREYTCFHARVLHSQADVALDVLTDMLANSLIRPADVATEREVILDEIAMHDDDPGEVAIEGAIGKLFAGSRLGPTVIGSATSIRRMPTRRITDFWRRHYTSNRMVVSAVGDLDHDDLCARLAGFDAALAPSPGGEVARPAAHHATEPRIFRRSNELAQTSVVLAFPGFGTLDPRREALSLLAVALGGGMSSRLFQEVRERRALAYTIDCSEAAWRDAGLVTIDWQALPERTPEILDVVHRIVADVRQHGITADELAAAKGQLLGQTVLHFENPGARMSRLGGAELAGDRRGIEDLLTDIRAVTLAEVNTLAAQVLGRVPVVSMAGAAGSRAAARRLQTAW
ncbi:MULTISPECIES: M16 family metallopeptidase [unclassified Luteococcus]|uniref:M16 family metallopeptidase n=1 Tax=unclassified Luteococcus TaxID=2639923 RepID=UPI00313E09C4